MQMSSSALFQYFSLQSFESVEGHWRILVLKKNLVDSLQISLKLCQSRGVVTSRGGVTSNDYNNNED